VEHRQVYKTDSPLNKNGNNILSILIGKNTIKYALYNDAFNLLDLSLITHSNLISKDVASILDSPLFNSITYSNCIIGLVSEFAVIPQEYFDDNKMDGYLAKQLGQDYKIAYSYDILENPNVRIVYKKDNDLTLQLNSFLKNTKVYNSVSPLINSMVANYTEDTAILNNFFEDQFDYICLKQGKLQMANRYNCDTPENYLYYLLNAMQINKASCTTAKVILSGVIDETDNRTKLSQSYILNTALLYDKTVNDSNNNSAALSQHYNLLALAKCAL